MYRSILMKQNKYQNYDQIIGETIAYSLDYERRNHRFLISEYYYNWYKNYYDSILKITLNTYLTTVPKIEFYDCSLKFRIKFLKQFKKYANIKFLNNKKHSEVWNPTNWLKEKTKFFNEIWKEYYEK